MNTLLDVDVTRTREMMELVLRDGAPISPEYPLVFRKEMPGRLIAIGEGDQVRSACAILVRDLIMPGITLRVGLIGSVSTAPDFQRQGLATHVLVAAEAELQQQGCAVGLLWGDDPNFYYARGYRPVGAEVDISVPRESMERLPKGDGIRSLRESDAAAVHAVYTRHDVRVDRLPIETEVLLTCPGMTTFVLERDGEVVAYACRDRGADLTDAIHEWGGDVDDVLALVRAHLRDRFPDGEPGQLFLMTPSSAIEVRRRLEEAGASSRVGLLGLGKVLNRASAARLMDQTVGPGGRVDLVDSPAGACFHLRGPNGVTTIDEESWLALMLPAYGMHEEVAEFQQVFGLTGATFPLQPFVWGLDSI